MCNSMLFIIIGEFRQLSIIVCVALLIIQLIIGEPAKTNVQTANLLITNDIGGWRLAVGGGRLAEPGRRQSGLSAQPSSCYYR